MKRIKIVFSIALIVLLVAVTLAACSSNENSGNENGEQTATENESGDSGADNESADSGAGNDAADEKVEGPPILKKYDPPITITTARWGGTDPSPLGETYGKNIHEDWMRDELGIIIEHQWLAPDWFQFEQKLVLSIATGEPFPDVVYDFVNPGNNTINKVLENYDQLLPVDEAFEKYASPTLKQAYAIMPEVWNNFKINGKSYALPVLSDGLGNANTLYYRQDWLDNVGLQVPSTIEELDAVLDAFKNKDPDKNGANDTNAITFGWKDDFSTYLSDTSWLFGAYGAIPQAWTKGADGKLVYGSVQPEIKQGLAKLRDWYSKGYIDPQSGVYNNWDAKDKQFVAEKTGVVSGPQWFYVVITDLQKNNPNAKIIPGPMPSGPDGKMGRFGFPSVMGAFMFSKNFEHIDAFFNYFNTVYEVFNPENEKFKYGLHEGRDYAMKDGKPLFGDDMKQVYPDYPDGYSYQPFALGYQTFNFPYVMYEANERVVAGETPETAMEMKMAKDPELAIAARHSIYNQKDIAVQDLFQGPPTETMQSRWDNLKKMEHEIFLKIIYNQLPLDEFDKFVEDWYDQGGDAITKEVNDWFASVQ